MYEPGYTDVLLVWLHFVSPQKLEQSSFMQKLKNLHAYMCVSISPYGIQQYPVV